MRVDVVEGNAYSDDAVFDIVHKFEFVTLRTLYTFVKEYALESRIKPCIVEMIEGQNGLPVAEFYVDGRVYKRIECEQYG